MDLFIFNIGLTLAAASIFLVKDYVRFLLGVHSVSGKVVSIQQVFVHRSIGACGKPFVSDGFYPVVEYNSETGPVSFTVIDPSTSGRFHVGDRIRLKVAKSRRKQRRGCKSATILVFLQLLLLGSMLASGIFSDYHLSTPKIILASIVLALCFAILILYTRDQDEQGINDFSHTRSGLPQLCLFEPTACAKWHDAWVDRRQLLKIRGSQAFGVFFMSSALILLLFAMQPLLRVLMTL